MIQFCCIFYSALFFLLFIYLLLKVFVYCTILMWLLLMCLLVFSHHYFWFFVLISGTVTYGVLKVEDGIDHVPHIVTTNTNFTNSNVQQMLTSNLNAQLYVIGNPNDVFISQGGNRAIAPRSTIVDGTPTVTTNIKKVRVKCERCVGKW